MKKSLARCMLTASAVILLQACTASEQPKTPGEHVKQDAGQSAVQPAAPESAMQEQTAQALAEGEQLFKRHCALCHRDGGNIVNPRKPLHKEAREVQGIKTAEDIIRIMRNPGPGMNKFDETTLPDSEARKIAEYVLKTY